MTIVEKEIRCPVGPKKLFTKLKLSGEPVYVMEGNLIEFTCWDCAKQVGRERNELVVVFHRFNFIGELVNTVVVPR